MKKVLFATSECVPFVKTGGLADVAGSLPKAFPRDEYDVRVMLPYYMCIPQKYREQAQYVTHFYMDMGWFAEKLYVGVMELELDGICYYFIDNLHYFDGAAPYFDMGVDVEKFCFFCKAVLCALPVLGFQPDIIHCHDWQAGLIPVFLHTLFSTMEFYQNTKTIMTVHNLRFQGIQSIENMKRWTGLPDWAFTPDRVEYKSDGNMLKGGMVFATAITTVSDTYAEEIKTPYYGEGLDSVLRYHAGKLHGIVNGIDYVEFNPAADPLIPTAFTADDFRKKKVKNKTAFQRELGLEENPRRMMLGVVSRLTDQKGFDLIEYAMDQLCQDYIQLVVLGTGDEKYENMFRHYAWKYGDRVSANICYNNDLAHKIYAASDAFLMPSQFEPCGLSQLISLRYGTVPIVRETGGLKDTVAPYNEFEGTGTGFSFANYNADEMLRSIRYAQQVYFDNKTAWNKLAERGMRQDFSWASSAQKYMELYESL